MRSFRRSSAPITVGDRPIEDFPTRLAQRADKRALAAESRDWQLVRSVLQPAERLRARVAVRFPDERNAAGHTFVTDQRVMFEFHERVVSVGLVYLVFVGRPSSGPGDFLIDAVVPDGPGAGRFATTMRIRDTEAFHDFFPTLLDATRALGAQPEVDASWGAPPSRAAAAREPRPAPQPAPSPAPAAAPAGGPSDDVVLQTLTTLLRPDETVLVQVDMVHNFGSEWVRVLATERRLLVVDGSVVWVALLSEVTLVGVGGAGTHLRLLAESLDDWRVLGGRRIAVDPAEQRRLVVRVAADEDGYRRLHDHLERHAAATVPAWPRAGEDASVLRVEEEAEGD